MDESKKLFHGMSNPMEGSYLRATPQTETVGETFHNEPRTLLMATSDPYSAMLYAFDYQLPNGNNSVFEVSNIGSSNVAIIADEKMKFLESLEERQPMLYEFPSNGFTQVTSNSHPTNEYYQSSDLAINKKAGRPIDFEEVVKTQEVYFMPPEKRAAYHELMNESPIKGLDDYKNRIKDAVDKNILSPKMTEQEWKLLKASQQARGAGITGISDVQDIVSSSKNIGVKVKTKGDDLPPM